MSIPVISTAIVNDPYWLYRLIASIDYPVDNLVIINNNGRGEIDEELDNMKKMTHKFIKKITVTHMPANIGLAASWNLTIKCYMNAPYWIFCNHDISFSSGLLEEMVETANKHLDVGIIFGKPGDTGDGSYDLFLIRDWSIQYRGLFDENLYPAYCEDLDYAIRLKIYPLKAIYKLSKPYYHGLSTDYYKTGENTKKSDPSLSEKLKYVNSLNLNYIDRKWGYDWETNPYQTPFNDPRMQLTTYSFDIYFMRQKYLGF